MAGSRNPAAALALIDFTVSRPGPRGFSGYKFASVERSEFFDLFLFVSGPPPCNTHLHLTLSTILFARVAIAAQVYLASVTPDAVGLYLRAMMGKIAKFRASLDN